MNNVVKAAANNNPLAILTNLKDGAVGSLSSLRMRCGE